MRRIRAFVAHLLSVFLVLGALGCTPWRDERPPELPVQLEGISASSRVVALSRSVGELWLLAGGKLVGVTDDALDLEGISQDTASIGSLSKPSLEQIVALEPDLVMLTEDLSAHREIHESLDALGIPVLVVDIDSFDDSALVMELLTEATGRGDLYDQDVTTVAAEIDALLAANRFEGTYLAIRTSATKNKVLKSDYFACDMLDDLGLTNIADDSSVFDELSLEAIAEADPDWIFVVLQGAGDDAIAAYREAFEQNPVWSELTAVCEGHVVILPKDLFQYKPNARWAEAYYYLYRILDEA